MRKTNVYHSVCATAFFETMRPVCARFGGGDRWFYEQNRKRSYGRIKRGKRIGVTYDFGAAANISVTLSGNDHYHRHRSRGRRIRFTIKRPIIARRFLQKVLGRPDLTLAFRHVQRDRSTYDPMDVITAGAANLMR